MFWFHVSGVIPYPLQGQNENRAPRVHEAEKESDVEVYNPRYVALPGILLKVFARTFEILCVLQTNANRKPLRHVYDSVRFSGIPRPFSFKMILFSLVLY